MGLELAEVAWGRFPGQVSRAPLSTSAQEHHQIRRNPTDHFPRGLLITSVHYLLISPAPPTSFISHKRSIHGR